MGTMGMAGRTETGSRRVPGSPSKEMHSPTKARTSRVPTYQPQRSSRKLFKEKEHMAEEEHEEVEHTVPWIAALTTYFSYAMLFLFGSLRDMLDNAAALVGLGFGGEEPANEKGYGKLLNDFQDFYTRRLYYRIQDCFNRPISSAPGAWIDVMEREFSAPDQSAMRPTGDVITALNLSSYNYLGFAESDLEMRDQVVATMRRLGVSSASPRSELGTTDVHRELEERTAAFLGKQAAVVFGMGFATNSTVLPVLAGAGGLIISDELNHSSIVVGARGSAARIQVFKHNCPKSLEETIRCAIAEGQPRTHRPWRKILVVVEGLYSMEGEICRLKEIVAVCKKYKAYVYVDEAHSIGALGATGRGVMEHCGVPPEDVDVFMGTYTKSFGSVGGYIASSQAVCDFVRRSSPGAAYACSMAPACATQASMAFRMLAGEDGTNKGQQKIQQLRRNANLFRAGLERMGCEVLGDRDSPVIPVMLYNPAKIPAFSRECLKRKLAVVVVGFPATPVIKSRVRFCISAAHTEADLISALRVVDKVAESVMVKYKWSGRPNVTPAGEVLRQSAKHHMEVVGLWDATHVMWSDTLRIDDDGRFTRGNGFAGSWNVAMRDGKTILRLEWDRWPTEELELNSYEDGDNVSKSPCASPRRHMFTGAANLVGSTPVQQNFKLRPREDPLSPRDGAVPKRTATFKLL
ncbi:pyridoxal phosphate-dependent transferase [Baffinella frigidus]|nr:pyridoxal phosphate-dependent transferase [Cryptophyta sp. CCMP2293]